LAGVLDAVPLLLRRVEQPLTLEGGIALEAAERIVIRAGFYHRDPRVFGELMDSFSPDLLDDCNAQARGVLSPRERSCVGRSLALFVLKAALAALLARCRCEPLRLASQAGRTPNLYDRSATDLRALPVASTLAPAASRP
jgi:cytochrome P450